MLRHTHATVLLENNAPLKYIQQRLGHKKLDTTKAYYMRIDVDRYKDKSIKLLDSLYDFHDRTPESKPPMDYIETIDSKGRKTKYMK